jgi:catechol 2,3-dioxygenase-like lactoylglutathione lyase family enzyme
MNWTLEVVIVPVTDVDRAKAFYADRLGFEVDHDTRPNDQFRVVQLTPPGSACSITIGTGLTKSTPGTYQGLHLVVTDIEAARAELVGRGAEVSEPFHFGAEGQATGLDPNRADYGTFMSLADPDGNGWLVQEVKYHAR